MDRRNSDDWDVIKLENLAKEYMGMRREIWSQLGAKTGEKWSVVEAKVWSSIHIHIAPSHDLSVSHIPRFVLAVKLTINTVHDLRP
jgi:hypothetical protein